MLSVNNYTDDNIGDINPIRYRSYYYDTETGLYYLNSRYYDPETGRFINAATADILENAKYDINGLNLYVYCKNNPIVGRESQGDASHFKKLINAIIAAVTTAIAATVFEADSLVPSGTLSSAMLAVASTFSGASKGIAVEAVISAAVRAATAAVQCSVESGREMGAIETTLRSMCKGDFKDTVCGASEGLFSALMMGGIGSLSSNPMFCFVAGTAVLTKQGKNAIETIQVGDIVPCVDHITGEIAEKRVVSTSVNRVNRLIELDIDGEIIRCTETHPFQVKGRGWVNASELAPNDGLYTKDWNTVIVKSVNLLELDEPVEVYNFEVEDCHTYFVGEQHILVHNGDCVQQGSYEIFVISRFGDAQVYVGKGPESRMRQSENRLKNEGYTIVSSQWTSADNSDFAFIDEYMKMAKYDFDFEGVLVNKRMSPGFKKFNSML